MIATLPIILLADDYLDDVYYSPTTEVMRVAESETVVHQPYYNKKAMQELVFIEDSVPARDSVNLISPIYSKTPARH